MQHQPTINRDLIARFAALLRRWLRFVFWLMLRHRAIPERAALSVMERRVRKLILARAMERIVLPKATLRRTRRPHGAPAGFRVRRGGRDCPSRHMRLALPSLRHLKPHQRLRALKRAHANIDALADRLIARIQHAFQRAPLIAAAPAAFVLDASAPAPTAPCADTS